MLSGYATQARGPVPEGLWGHGDDVFQYSHDMDKAKALLSEAGYPDGGFTLDMTYITGNELERKCAELFQSECAKLGITINIRPLTEDMFQETGRSSDINRRQDLSMLLWYPDVAGPYTFLYSIYHQSDPILWNWTYYKNDAYDKLIEDADTFSGTDRAAAAEMFVQAQEILAEDAPTINIYDTNYTRLTSATVGGYHDNPCYPKVIFFYNCLRQA